MAPLWNPPVELWVRLGALSVHVIKWCQRQQRWRGNSFVCQETRHSRTGSGCRSGGKTGNVKSEGKEVRQEHWLIPEVKSGHGFVSGINNGSCDEGEVCRQRVNSASWWANEHKPPFPLILLRFSSCLFISLFCSQYIVFALLIQWSDWDLQETLVTVASWSRGRWLIYRFMLFSCFSRVCSTSGWSLTLPFGLSPGNTVFWLETFDYGLAHRFCTFTSVIIKPFYSKPPSPRWHRPSSVTWSVWPPPPPRLASCPELLSLVDVGQGLQILNADIHSSVISQHSTPSSHLEWFIETKYCLRDARFLFVCLFRLSVESNKVYTSTCCCFDVMFVIWFKTQILFFLFFGASVFIIANNRNKNKQTKKPKRHSRNEAGFISSISQNEECLKLTLSQKSHVKSSRQRVWHYFTTHGRFSHFHP